MYSFYWPILDILIFLLLTSFCLLCSELRLVGLVFDMVD